MSYGGQVSPFHKNGVETGAGGPVLVEGFDDFPLKESRPLEAPGRDSRSHPPRRRRWVDLCEVIMNARKWLLKHGYKFKQGYWYRGNYRYERELEIILNEYFRERPVTG